MVVKQYDVTQAKKFLEFLENNGYRWLSGHRPTEWIPSKHFKVEIPWFIFINVKSKQITMSPNDELGYKYEAITIGHAKKLIEKEKVNEGTNRHTKGICKPLSCRQI